MMKKIICLLLAIVMSVSLCACGGDSSGGGSTNENENTPNFTGLWIDDTCGTYIMVNEDGSGQLYTEDRYSSFSKLQYTDGQITIGKRIFDVVTNNGETELKYIDKDIVLKKESDVAQKPFVISFNGTKSMNEERFADVMEVVYLTTENWREYIKVIPYTTVWEEKDPFGEVVSTVEEKIWEFGAQVDGYYRYEVVIELEHKVTKEKTIYEFKGKGVTVDEKFNLDDYECTRIQGKFYIVKLPQDAVHSPLPEWNYKKGFILRSISSATPYKINEIGAIQSNGNEDWEEEYMK